MEIVCFYQRCYKNKVFAFIKLLYHAKVMFMIYFIFYCFSFVEVDQSTSYGKCEHVVSLATEPRLNHKTLSGDVRVNVNIYWNIPLSRSFLLLSRPHGSSLVSGDGRFLSQFCLETALACMKRPPGYFFDIRIVFTQFPLTLRRGTRFCA